MPAMVAPFSPYLQAPSLNVGTSGATTASGLATGHLVVGQPDIDAFVGIKGDEYYADVGQETRGISYTVRNTRTVADEATLGWDFYGVIGSVVVTNFNTQFIKGNQKAVVGELHFQSPNSGTYTVNKAHNFQADIPTLGAGVTLTDWYGVVVNAPPLGGGSITTGYGINIENISLPSIKAAINLQGTGAGGQILWPGGVNLQAPSAGTLAALSGSTTLWSATASAMTVGVPLKTAASTTAAAGLNLASGTAPTNPTDGDFWYDGVNLKFRIGGVTKTVSLT